MPSFTSVITWVTGAVTASQFNQQIRDNMSNVNGRLNQLNVTSDSAKAKITPALVGARVTKSAFQTITTSTATAITFDAADIFDSDAFHNPASNNTRITIPASMGGYYEVGACVEWSASGTGNRRVSLVKNATTTIAIDTRAGHASQTLHQNITTIYQFAAGDYIECHVFHTLGSDLNVTAVGDFSPTMWIHRLSSS